MCKAIKYTTFKKNPQGWQISLIAIKTAIVFFIFFNLMTIAYVCDYVRVFGGFLESLIFFLNKCKPNLLFITSVICQWKYCQNRFSRFGHYPEQTDRQFFLYFVFLHTYIPSRPYSPKGWTEVYQCTPTVRRYVFRSHVIGGEPIAINRAQILIPSCYWEFHRKTQCNYFCSTWDSNPRPLA